MVENGALDPLVRRDVSQLGAAIPARYAYQRQAGLNRARNRGCREARHDLIAMIDDDCVPREDWIESIIDQHARFPQAGVIGGRVELEFLADPPHWLAGEFLLNLCRVHWAERTRPVRDGEFVVGANMSFRKSVFDRAGGFSEEFGLSGRQSPQLANDETLFNHRVERCGCGRILYSPGIVVRHQIPSERLRYAYHEQRRYGQGVSDIDLAIHENRQDPLSASERFRQVVQHQRWHLEELLRASRDLDPTFAREFRERLVRSRIAYLAGAQDRVLNRFVPGSLSTSLTVDEARPYAAGRNAAARRASARAAGSAHDILESLLYRERPRPLRAEIPRDRRVLHARVAFLKGFRDQLYGLDGPGIQQHHLADLERGIGRTAQ